MKILESAKNWFCDLISSWGFFEQRATDMTSVAQYRETKVIGKMILQVVVVINNVTPKYFWLGLSLINWKKTIQVKRRALL